MKSSFQTTLGGQVVISGRGVHSDLPACLVLHPAPVDTGLVFIRTGLTGGRVRMFEASWRKVQRTDLCTALGDRDEELVATVEHLFAALAGLGVDNARIEIDGPEMPIMDGSARAFVAAIDEVGQIHQMRPRRQLRVLKTIRVEHGLGFAELRPAASGFGLDIEIDFDNAAIGRQRRLFDVKPDVFRSEIAPARTFGFLHDVARLRSLGLAKGSSLDNSIGIDGQTIMNPEGLRFADEFVRHKALDAIGDLALAGAPILGRFRSYRPGHKLNFMALEALFADQSAYELSDGRHAFEPAPMRAGIGRVAAAAYAAEAN